MENDITASQRQENVAYHQICYFHIVPSPQIYCYSDEQITGYQVCSIARLVDYLPKVAERREMRKAFQFRIKKKVHVYKMLCVNAIMPIQK